MNIKDSIWSFVGDYTFYQIPKYLEKLYALKIDKPITLDLSQIQNIDTSILSFIFEIKRKAKLSNHKVNLVKVPKNLIDLATLYGVQKFLK
ncbi:MAG: STAS domain-containing protein [Proteobacteria bacterium]|jgi:ABC-type transporter Mla MlaB component|nr:STAS domain-containing protein [Pseudomonadota bacterium]MDA0941462.1 STAS domain-containing protein [Pseudomonadota bacterium]MDA1034406.1 STAS domain-containing protein [Pseudomonadota bacterium]